jgi:hypothetical protein
VLFFRQPHLYGAPIGTTRAASVESCGPALVGDSYRRAIPTVGVHGGRIELAPLLASRRGGSDASTTATSGQAALRRTLQVA